MESSDARKYLSSHNVEDAIAAALSQVIKERPSNPLTALAEKLIGMGPDAAASNDSNPLGDEELRKLEKPIVSSERAVQLAAQLFGLQVIPSTLKDLDSYDDRNFYFGASPINERPQLMEPEDQHAMDAPHKGSYHYVLKVHNGVESMSPAFIECQNLAMDALRKTSVWCPHALPALDGASIAFAECALASGTVRKHAVRCLPYRPGAILGNISPPTSLLCELGRVCANVSAALIDFDHPAAHRTFIWDLAQTLSVRPLVKHLVETERREIITSVLDEFESHVLPRARELRRCVIHGDINDQNVLISEPSAGEAFSILGIIDFGDMCYSWLINEIAIAAAYAVIALHYDNGNSPDAKLPSEIEACVAMVSSYARQMATQGLALKEAEWEVLPTLIASRIAVSLCVGAYSSSKDPANEYLKLTLLPGLKALKALRSTPNQQLLNAMKEGKLGL